MYTNYALICGKCIYVGLSVCICVSAQITGACTLLFLWLGRFVECMQNCVIPIPILMQMYTNYAHICGNIIRAWSACIGVRKLLGDALFVRVVGQVCVMCTNHADHALIYANAQKLFVEHYGCLVCVCVHSYIHVCMYVCTHILLDGAFFMRLVRLRCAKCLQIVLMQIL
jgi:hypothetical protein